MIVNSLVHQEYTSVARMTGGRALSARDLERIVAQHAQTLIAPPDAYENLRIVQVSDAPPTFQVTVPLWSQEYVLSDLILELRMTQEYPGIVDVEVISLAPPPEDLTSRTMNSKPSRTSFALSLTTMTMTSEPVVRTIMVIRMSGHETTAVGVT